MSFKEEKDFLLKEFRKTKNPKYKEIIFQFMKDGIIYFHGKRTYIENRIDNWMNSHSGWQTYRGVPTGVVFYQLPYYKFLFLEFDSYEEERYGAVLIDELYNWDDAKYFNDNENDESDELENDDFELQEEWYAELHLHD